MVSKEQLEFLATTEYIWVLLPRLPNSLKENMKDCNGNGGIGTIVKYCSDAVRSKAKQDLENLENATRYGVESNSMESGGFVLEDE